MSPDETLQIERACERLILDAVYYTDHREYAAFAALFAEAGTLSRPGGSPLVGPAAIQKSYEARPANRLTRHLCSNIRVTVESAERARALTYVLVIAGNCAEPAPDHFGWAAEARRLVGEFEDEFERTARGWRIRKRLARFVLHT